MKRKAEGGRGKFHSRAQFGERIKYLELSLSFFSFLLSTGKRSIHFSSEASVESSSKAA
jgi:hypothetical protein